MAEHGKKYQEAAKLVDKDKEYFPKEAVELIKKAAYAKFDETVELHLRMGLDPRKADQVIRGVTLLPHGIGKQIRVLVFAQGEGAKIATDAGADYVGVEDLVEKIEQGWLDFEVAISTPDMMGKVGKLGKILGRKGLMPNPKSGTVVQQVDIARAVGEARKGRVEFKMDRAGIIHLPIGKVGFDADKLVENIAALFEAISKAKPSGVKGQLIKSATLTSTMGPGVKLDLRSALALAPA